MLQRQLSYMKDTEDDTLQLIEELDRKKTFIKSMPLETQELIIRQYQLSKEFITVHGSEHKITLDQLRSLAEDLIRVRHLASAATVLDRACLGCKRCYGREHVNVSLVLSRQAFALSSDRKFQEAYDCYDKSLKLMEKLYNFQVNYSSHSSSSRLIVMIPTIAVPVIDGLGYTLEQLGRYSESEFCFRILLNYYITEDPTIDRKREPYIPTDGRTPMGRQHPEALKAINKLAKALQAQSKFREAEELCGDSLDDCIQALGVNHPTTQTSVVTMAQLKHSQGKLQEAEDMYRRSLKCNEEVLGINHIETLANVSHIADLRAEQRDFRGAEVLYSRALAGYEMILGKHNSTTIESVHNVGAMLLKQQKPTQALVHLDRALEERSAYYGDTHPATLATLFCVGKAYHLESLWKHRPDYHELVQKALEILERALAGTDTALGKGSVEAIAICEYLAEVLLQCNRFSAAILYSRRVYLYYHNYGKLPSDSAVKISRSRAPSRPPSRADALARKGDDSSREGEKKILFGPMHKRTAEAAYQLGTLLENCSDDLGMNDAERHMEAANLFAQAAEVYRLQLDRFSRDPEYCERNRVRRTTDYNYDSAEGKVPDDELSLEELRELMDDAQEQHEHAVRCSMY